MPMQYVENAITLAIVAIFTLLAIRIYKREETKGKWWVIIIIFLIGRFSISLDLPLFGHTHNLAIFPLGAGLFYLFTRTRQQAREIYKPYIWLGFFANYAFFVCGILTIFVTNALFPPGHLSTYIESFEDATILNIHPSAQDKIQLSNNAYELLDKSIQTEVHAHEWYNGQAYNQMAYKEEKFPYMLQNVTATAGLNIDVFYYIEQDGKGLLVQTPDQHYYFRTEDTFIEKDGEQQ